MLLKKDGGTSGDSFTKAKPPPGSKRTIGIASAAGPTTLSLPDEAEEPITDIADCTLLVHGETKVGKTSLASQFEDPLFLFTEPGGRGLRVKRREVQSWVELKGYITLIRKSDAHRTIVLDTVQLAYAMCHKHVCKEMGVDHPSEGNYGDVWNAIESQFCDEMLRLMKSGRGVIFISHSEVVEFQSRTGTAYNKTVPAVNKNARAFLKEKCDILAYYGYFGKDRYLTVSGSDDLEAGHRMDEQFLTTDGQRVHSIPMFDEDNPAFGARDAYARLVAAFNNEQEGTGEPETLRTILADTKAPREKTGRGRR